MLNKHHVNMVGVHKKNKCESEWHRGNEKNSLQVFILFEILFIRIFRKALVDQKLKKTGE